MGTHHVRSSLKVLTLGSIIYDTPYVDETIHIVNMKFDIIIKFYLLITLYNLWCLPSDTT